MAKRRRRKTTARKAAPRRRRRRVRANPGGLGPARRTVAVKSNPGGRRRRRRHALRATRRKFRRNPDLSRGIVGGIVQGLKDGGAVVVGQVGARKVRGAITGMLPASAQATVATGAGKIALSILSSVAVAMVAKRVIPAQARMIAAGAFAESINSVIATTPLAPYLAAYPTRRIAPTRRAGVSAYPGAPALTAGGGLSAYPGFRQVGQPMSAGVL